MVRRRKVRARDQTDHLLELILREMGLLNEWVHHRQPASPEVLAKDVAVLHGDPNT